MTSFIGDHGLLAVFLLMTVAAVLPAASEVTMLYGGALASGALAGQISLFGHDFKSGFPAYLAVVVAGVAGNTLGAAGGWWIGVRGGHPLLERYGRYIHVTPAQDRPCGAMVRPVRGRRGAARLRDAARSLVRRHPGRDPRGRRSAVHRVGARRDHRLLRRCSPASAGRSARAGSTVHHDFRYVELAVVLAIVVFAAVLLIRRRRSTTMASSADSPR